MPDVAQREPRPPCEVALGDGTMTAHELQGGRPQGLLTVEGRAAGVRSSTSAQVCWRPRTPPLQSTASSSACISRCGRRCPAVEMPAASSTSCSSARVSGPRSAIAPAMTVGGPDPQRRRQLELTPARGAAGRDPRAGEREQRAQLLGRYVVPGRAEHVRAQERPGFERRGQVGPAEATGAAGQRPQRRLVVLRLDGARASAPLRPRRRGRVRSPGR